MRASVVLIDVVEVSIVLVGIVGAESVMLGAGSVVLGAGTVDVGEK